ncbi:MAG: Crp/Fnr family transcriptional regulator [candidate division KSB1 bacterium]|nr:Crp/Fnr family transcriptional regulator [candidate division KSB1 bacterium]
MSLRHINNKHNSIFERLYRHILNYIELSEAQFSESTRFFIPRSIRRKDFLCRAGEVGRYIAFVHRGCLRSYTIDKKGAEHVVQFAIEEWWIADLYSFLTNEPATYYIDALEDSEVLLLDRPSQEELCAQFPRYERFFRLLLERNYIANHRRIAATLSLSAGERYLLFLQTYPQLVERLPQHQIASFLGITPESLSRIRRKLARKTT